MGLWIGSRLLVDVVFNLDRSIGGSELVIRLTIVAIGMSTPECTFHLVAVRHGHRGMSVGNVVGSNIFNILGILGIGAIRHPLVVTAMSRECLLWLTAITILVIGALWWGQRLSRLEAGLFVLSEGGRWILGLFKIFG